MDLSKAFGILDHDILLQKLEMIGIRVILVVGSRVSFVITFIHHLSPFANEYHKALYLVPHFFFIYINDIVNASSNL